MEILNISFDHFDRIESFQKFCAKKHRNGVIEGLFGESTGNVQFATCHLPDAFMSGLTATYVSTVCPRISDQALFERDVFYYLRVSYTHL